MALTDQVIMPGSDYQAICDATRSLTGTTGTLKSGEVAAKILSGVKTETKTVALDMASGNQIIDSTSGKYMTQVTVEKPSTLIPSNIKKEVEIGGITGTYTGKFVSLPFTKVKHLFVDNGIVSFTSDKLYHTLIVSDGTSNPTLMTAIIETTNGNNYAHSENSSGMYNTSSTALSVSYNSSTSTYSYTWKIADSSSNYMYEGNFDVYGY